jgi:hypothetical protein
MTDILLIQLPIPKLNYGMQTGNVPLGAGCLKMAADMPGVNIDILPEDICTYLGDDALIKELISRKPDIIGFTIYQSYSRKHTPPGLFSVALR